MAIEHKVIPEADLHEPKGVSTATIDTSYRSDGAGSGSWKRDSYSDHGDMNITNNATATAVTAAVDATLNTDTDYVKISAGWSSGHESGIVFNVDSLLVAVAGDYLFSFWAAVKIPLNNNFIGVKFGVNGLTPYSLQKIVSQSATTNDYRNLYGTTVLTLAAGDYVNVYIAGSKTDSLVVEEAGLSMQLLHAA